MRNSDPKPLTGNEVITAGQRLSYVLGQLESRRGELSAVLPPDITFERFQATINQALRNNPELLDCDARSLVNACVKAAYDGLRVDGREAAIVWEWATVKVPGQPDKRQKQARYMPMYQGLVQQVLRGGMVLAMEADVVFENDDFKILRGTNPGIHHEPLITGDRGKMVAVYNVATLPSGHKAVCWMRADEVIDVQKESKSGWDKSDDAPKGVWKRWPGEQWKKTVLRRHRKTLPIGRDIVDSEAVEEFPQFDRSLPHPSLAAPPRPTRQQAVEDQRGMNDGVPLDLGEPREMVTVDQQRSDERDDQAAKALDLPASPAEWDMWKADLARKIRDAADIDAANKVFADHRAEIEAAPAETRDAVTEALTSRIADLMTGGDA